MAEKRKFEAVGELINTLFQANNMDKRRTNFTAFNNWEEIVGRDIAKNTEPLKFYQNTLVIKVKNSVWMQELQYMKPQLLEKIRLSFPETTIRDLMFKVGKV